MEKQNKPLSEKVLKNLNADEVKITIPDIILKRDVAEAVQRLKAFILHKDKAGLITTGSLYYEIGEIFGEFK